MKYQLQWPEIPTLFKTHPGFAGLFMDEAALSIESLVWLNILPADKHPS